jgi:alpha-galactosidase
MNAIIRNLVLYLSALLLALAALGCGSSNKNGNAGTGGSGIGGTDTSTATGGSTLDGSVAGTGGGGGSSGTSGTGAAGTTGTSGTGGPTEPIDATLGDGTSVTGGTGGAGGDGGTGGTSGTGGSSDIVGAKPPMGWNSWNTFACNPSEDLLKGVADTFVSSGMAAVGYEYVNIDDCWMSGRDASGALQWDTSKFPSGIPALADYMHGKGLKLGIYETPSATTCAGKTGGAGHEQQDAQTFADWGVDYLKYDHCQTTDMGSFARMHDALIATGRPIFYSINPVYGYGSCVPPSCMIPSANGNIPIQEVANLWRIGFDINASWSSVTGLIDIDKPLAQYAGPGHWNDPDMLEVGRGMSADEDRAHFGMWAILAAPLLAGNDIRSMSQTTKDILTNADVIAVDQDPLGKQGTVVATPGANLEVWSKELSGTNVRAVGLLNRSEAAASMTVQWSALGIRAGAATVRDLWNKTDLGSSTDSYTANNVPRHGMVMLKVTSTQ